MVPSAYVRLDAWPLTPNGKLDRRALPAPADDAYARAEYEAPRGAKEEALAAIWRELLHVERVSRHDNFFELGGHSLLAVQLVSRLRQALSVEVALGTVFDAPVLSALAERLEAENSGGPAADTAGATRRKNRAVAGAATAMVPDATGRRQRGVPHERCGAA